MTESPSSTARLALCPGSFDPPTLGHEEMVRRARRLFDRVVVAILHNPAKRALFSVEERLELVREIFADDPAIEAEAFSGLLVDYARRRGACAVIRGVRGVTDFDYEWSMVHMNRELAPSLETVLLVPTPRVAAISSTLVKDIAALGGDVSQFVPPLVARRLAERVRSR